MECTGNPAARWCELHPIWCKDWSQGHVTSNGNSATGNWKTSFWENQPHWFFVCVYKKWNSDDWFIFLKHLNYYIYVVKYKIKSWAPKILVKKRPKVRRPTTSLPRAGPNVPWHPGARDLLLRSHLRTGLGPGKNETIPGLFLDPHQPCNSGLQLKKRLAINTHCFKQHENHSM